MRLFQHRAVGFYLGFVLLFTIAMCTAVIAYAAGPSSNTKVAANIKGGSLTESNSTNQVSVKVNKNVKSVNYSLPITVTDARGSGGGWNLMITSTRLTYTVGKNKNKLPTNASRITGMSVACAVNSTCTKPINSHSYRNSFIIPAGDTPPPAVEFFDSSVGSGLGAFLLTMMVQVNIPDHTDAGIYTSTIYLSVVAGP